MFIVLAIGSSVSIVSFGMPLTIGIAQPNSVPADQPREPVPALPRFPVSASM
jgi:hypothetical protein